MLKAEDISVHRGDVPIFTRVHFTLGSGHALRITGRNGAGKSTLLRVIAGMRPPDAGALSWHGEPISSDQCAHAARVAYLGHKAGLKTDLTVRENLALYCASRCTDIMSALREVGLGHCADTLAQQLSAGQKRRVTLAAIRLKNARIWLLDEPGVGLDHMALGLLEDLVKTHIAQQGIVIVTTHAALPIAFTHGLALPDAHPLAAHVPLT